jgi:hypothetical protein
MYILRVNPTDFDGRPKRQEKPEVAQVERLSVTPKRGDSTCPSPRSMSSKDATPRLVSARYQKRLGLLKALNDGVVAAADISPDDLVIMLYETPGENISFGRGLAQRAHISDKDPRVAR